MKIAEAKRQIAELEAEVARLSKLEKLPPVMKFAKDMRKIVDFMPSRPRFVGSHTPDECEDLEAALLDIESQWIDSDTVDRIFDFLALLGERPAGTEAADLDEAITTLTYKMRDLGQWRRVD